MKLLFAKALQKPLLTASRHLPRLYLPLLVVLCFVQNWRVIGAADDFWAHAAIGRWIGQHAEVPQRTLFLWGASQPWIAHSWGTQLWFSELMNLGGERGGPYLALLFSCSMVALCFALLWREWARRGQVSTLALLFFALGTACAATRGRPRPELFSCVFFTVLLLSLLREDQYSRMPENAVRRGLWTQFRWRAAALAALFALWANMHGQVAAGLLLLALTAVCDAAQARFQKTEDRAALRLLALRTAVLLGVCAVAISFNPYGLRYWNALAPVGGAMFAYIEEWKPLWKTPYLDEYVCAAGFLLALFALVAWLGTAKRRWAHGVWLVVWVVLFLSARRHLWMLSLVSLAVLAANSETIQPRVFWQALGHILLKSKADLEITPLWRAAMRCVLVFFLILVIARQTPAAWRQRWPRAVSEKLPAAAATRLIDLARRRPGLRVVSDYEYSSYLQWRCAGAPPLFIDLLNAYPDQLLFDYFAILRAEQKGRQLMVRRDVDCVFLRPYKTKDNMAKLARYLDSNRAWRCVYRQDEATIWLKIR